MKFRSITIVMPALNEEASIGKTIKNIPLDILRRRGFNCDVIVVDGGSKDRTTEIARNAGAEVYSAQRGYGRQYLKGFSRATGDIIVTADSDNSYPMKDIPRLVKALIEQELDFISTNRFASMDPGSMRFSNRLGNIFLTFLANYLFDLELRDSQSGMWVFRRQVLDILDLCHPGMAFSQEIKIEANIKSHAREIDSEYSKRIGESKLNRITDGLGNVVHLLRMRKKMRRAKYL